MYVFLSILLSFFRSYIHSLFPFVEQTVMSIRVRSDIWCREPQAEVRVEQRPKLTGIAGRARALIMIIAVGSSRPWITNEDV
jgi:hypothetical protein